ncbi:MAG: DEAD/DEAH box helicase [Chitinophagaceae bacterium]|nr:DEAD/DEAH box helicase [Chitinophagaceae bacterium]
MKSTILSTEDILQKLKIDALNKMQLAAIETVDKNDNMVLLSATGSGKTLAFLFPLIKAFDASHKKTQALIITPSRELALQIEKVFKQMGTPFKITCCYGGHLRETEENNLKEPPALLVGTPGRLADHIRRGNITTDAIRTLVLDEFDKSLEAGFQEEMAFIIRSLPAVQKRILTSATESVEIPAFVGLADPVRLNFLTSAEGIPGKLEIKKLLSPINDKIASLFQLICFIGDRSVIVFCNHRDSVERTSGMLKEKGITNGFYHGAMEQRDRDSALSKFRNGSVNVLVTTDLAARGLDIPNIRFIIHYHLPLSEDSYMHRNGRTARMDASGTVVIILSPDEKLPGYIDADIEVLNLPADYTLPEKPKWVTLFIGAGKKDKVNKVDIVGFLSKKGGLKKEDIGLIEVKDFFSFVAVRKSRMPAVLPLVQKEKIKNKKVKIEIAR